MVHLLRTTHLLLLLLASFRVVAGLLESPSYVTPTPPPPPDVLCPEGWKSWDNYCYYFSTHTANWDEAHSYCQTSYGSILASVKNQKENDYVYSMMQGKDSNAWVGLHDKGDGKKWIWVDDSDFIYYRNWNTGEPNNYGGNEHCGEMMTTYNGDGKWNDMPCSTRNYFVCKMTVRTCPEGWIFNNNKCYYASNFPETWGEAQDRCREFNSQADLVSLHSDEESEFFRGLLDSGSPGSWIGLLYQHASGTWKWSDGSDSSYTHWNEGEPNNIGVEYCAETIQYTGFWNNLHCGESRYFGCQVIPTHIVGCDPGWVYASGYCYFFNHNFDAHQELRNFEGAQKECQHLGANLVSIHSKEENDIVFSMMDGYYDFTGVWIGLRNGERGQGMSWVDGSPVTFTAWDTESSNAYPCTKLGVFDGLWAKDECSSTKDYLCKKAPETRPIESLDDTCDECQNRVKQEAPSVDSQPSAQANSTPEPNSVLPNDPSSSFLPLLPSLVSPPPPRSLPPVLSSARKHAFRRQKRHVSLSSFESPPPPPPPPPPSPEEGKDLQGHKPKMALDSSEESLTDVIESRQVALQLDPPTSTTPVFTLSHHRFGTKPSWHDDLAFPLADIPKTEKPKYTMILWSTEPPTPPPTPTPTPTSSVQRVVSLNTTTSSSPVQSSGSPDSPSSSSSSSSPSSPLSSSSSVSSNSSSSVSSNSSSRSRPMPSSVSPAPSPSTPLPPSASPASIPILSPSSQSAPTETAPHQETDASPPGSLSPSLAKDPSPGNSEQTLNRTNEVNLKADPTPSKPPEMQNLCIKGDIPYKSSCYKTPGLQHNWQDAEGVCETLGGHLVVVNDRFEGAFLSAILIDLGETAWIGLSGRFLPGRGMDFGWVNGDPVAFTNWDEYEPETSRGSCVTASGDSKSSGLWSVRDCKENHQIVCEYDRKGYTRPPTPPPTTTPAPKHCSDGWTQHEGKCYKLFQDPTTWEKAEIVCSFYGGHLTSIGSMKEQNFLHGLDGVTSIDSRLMAIWVGLSMPSDQSGYQWSDGSPLDHLYWADGQPDSHYGRERCVAVNRNTFQYSDYVCESYKPYICKSPEGLAEVTTTTPVVTPTPDVACEDDSTWLLYSDFCYKVYPASSGTSAWDEARELCAQEGGDLVSIHSYEENYWLLSKTYKMPDRMMWTGGRAFYDSGFTWVDGSPFDFGNWAVNEPNNHNDQEDCLSFYSFDNGYWNDMNCGKKLGRICKRPHGDVVTLPPTAPPKGNCPSGWVRLGGKCYIFSGSNVTATMDKARAACRQLSPKADLASVHSEAQSGFMVLMAGWETKGVWVGLRKEAGVFVWTDNSPVDFTNWAPGEPNGGDVSWTVDHDGFWGPMEYIPVMDRHYPSLDLHKNSMWRLHRSETGVKPTFGGVYYPKIRIDRDVLDLDTDRRTNSNLRPRRDTRSPSVLPSTPEETGAKDLSPEEAPARESFEVSKKSRLTLLARTHPSPPQSPLPASAGGRLSPSSPSSKSTRFRNRRKRSPILRTRREHCVEIFLTRERGKWNDQSCEAKLPFICQRILDETIATPAPVPMCDAPYDLYESFYDSCYRFISEPMSWQGAESTCKKDGAHLVSVQDLGINSYLWAVMRNLGLWQEAWIGLNSLKNQDEFVWTDGWPTVYTHWRDGQPDVTGENQRCTSLSPEDSLWSVQDCADSRPFFCVHSEVPPPTPDPPVEGSCPDTRWKNFGGGFCYLIVNEEKTWGDANWQCMMENANLASLHSEQEKDLLLKAIQQIRNPVWIGLIQKEHGFGWTDGTPLDFVFWEKGEPNDGDEECGEMYTTGGSWNDAQCSSIRSFVCKTPKIAHPKPSTELPQPQTPQETTPFVTTKPSTDASQPQTPQWATSDMPPKPPTDPHQPKTTPLTTPEWDGTEQVTVLPNIEKATPAEEDLKEEAAGGDDGSLRGVVLGSSSSFGDAEA